MTNITNLRKDVETIRRVVTPRDNSKGEEILQLLRDKEKDLDAFERLPTEEKQRIIKEWKESPAEDFSGHIPEYAMYAEALKKASIRDLEARL